MAGSAAISEMRGGWRWHPAALPKAHLGGDGAIINGGGLWRSSPAASNPES